MPREVDEALERYITVARRFPKLTRDEELALAKRWKRTRDPTAADTLVRAHLRYVIDIARTYDRYGLPLAELIAEGNFGIVHALRKFEPKRGYRFVTYAAHWIRCYVLGYVIRSWSLVGAGSGALRSRLFFSLRRERARMMALVGDSDRAHEILAAQFGVTPTQIAMMVQRLETRDLSLDGKVFDNTGPAVIDMLVSPKQDQETRLAADQACAATKLVVRDAMRDLDLRERYIVENRMMADAEDELTLAELGRRLGVSRERARQLETRAKHKLRQRIRDLQRANPTRCADLAGA